MRGSFWWVDRWQQSQSYKDMTLAEQGAFRNLLDELWLRGGSLPSDDRILAKLCGDAIEWPTVKKAVLLRFYKKGETLRNKTHDEVSAESKRRAKKQADYRARSGNGRGNVIGNADGNDTGNAAGDVTHSPFSVHCTKEPDPVNKHGVSRTRESIHDARNRLTEGNPDIPAIDRLDEDIAFEESRFNALALSIGQDRIQAVLDSLPRPKSVGAFSASRWLATGRSGIGRDERAMTRLKLTNDGLEAWKREVESPSGRKKGPAPAWDRGIAHDVPDEVILAWDPRLGPKPDSLREPAITRQTQTQEMPS